MWQIIEGTQYWNQETQVETQLLFSSVSVSCFKKREYNTSHSGYFSTQYLTISIRSVSQMQGHKKCICHIQV